MSEQLPLQFEFQAYKNFSNFYPGENAEIIDHLQQLFTHKEQQIFLWGDSGTGKTHCLQAIAQMAKNCNKTCFFYELKSDQLPDPSILDGLENYDLVCFDNIEQITDNTEWEHAFFNFFNLHRDSNKQLVLSANCPPKFIPIQLADLKTRMNWGLTLKLNALSDDQQLKALIHKANHLGLEISEKVGRFLITHYSRDLPSIWILLNKIEYATLAAKRKLTIPFLKQIMSDQNTDETR